MSQRQINIWQEQNMFYGFRSRTDVEMRILLPSNEKIRVFSLRLVRNLLLNLKT